MNTQGPPINKKKTLNFNKIQSMGWLVFAILLFVMSFGANAQLLDPLQVFESAVTCPGDYPGNPNFQCTSNDIKIEYVELSGPASCTQGQQVTANIVIDLEVNANIRYNPMIWISENGIDPRSTGEGSVCFVSSVPDGPITPIPELDFFDANGCADIDVPNNNFLLSGLDLGVVDFLCQDTDNDGLAEIPMMATWKNSPGLACEQGAYPINDTPSKCDAFTVETNIGVNRPPGLSLQKFGTLNDNNNNGMTDIGDSISYSFLVENTGGTPLTGISVSDPVLDSVSGGPISLGVGDSDSTTFSGEYLLQQTDINLGFFPNTATATANEGANAVANFVQSLEFNPSMTVSKSSGTTVVEVPGTVTYEYLVTNTGNTMLTSILLSDDNDNDDMSCPANELASDAFMTCTATHTVTTDELIANGSPTPGSGVLFNTVTANADQVTAVMDNLSIPMVEPVVPATPAAVAATDGDFYYKVRVDWANVSSESYFNVFRCVSADPSTCSMIGQPAADTLFFNDFDAAADGTVHFYRVSACNFIDQCSELSDPDPGFRTPGLIFWDSFDVR